MSNFKNLLSSVLTEQNKSFAELEKEGIICERSFYQYKDYTPVLPTIIRIANYLKVSLDYLSGRKPENNFKNYKDEPNYYANLTELLKTFGISHYKFCADLHIGKPNFTYWKKGTLPKLRTLVAIADYLNCSIDDLLDTE